MWLKLSFQYHTVILKILVLLQHSVMEEIRQRKTAHVTDCRLTGLRRAGCVLLEVHMLTLINCDGLDNTTEVLSFLRMFGAFCLQAEVFLPGKILDAKYSL